MNAQAVAYSSSRMAAEAFAKAGQHDQAVDSYRAALREHEHCGRSLLGLGKSLMCLGELEQASEALKKASTRLPQPAVAFCAQAEVARRQGLSVEALGLLERATALDPQNASAWVAMGKLLREQRRLPEAVQALEKAVSANERSVAGWSLLSNALRESQRAPEAVAAAERALAMDPMHGAAHLNLGSALHRCQQYSSAAVHYAVSNGFAPLRAAALANWKTLRTRHSGQLGEGLDELVPAVFAQPDSGVHWAQLSRWARRKRRLPVAIACAHRAAEQLRTAESYEQLARLSCAAGHGRVAEKQAVQAIALQPTRLSAFQAWAEALVGESPRTRFDATRRELAGQCPEDWDTLRVLAVCARNRDQPSLALQLTDRVLALRPDDVSTQKLRCGALGDLGRFVEAASGLRALVQKAPQLWSAHSQLLFSLHFDPLWSPTSPRREHERFGAAVAACVACQADETQVLLCPETPRGTEGRSGWRPVRLGYISPDLKRHPVAYLLEAVLRNHDRSRFEIVCFSDTPHPDEVTARLKAMCWQWHDTCALPSSEFVSRVRSLQCDLVVELAGHTRGNRLAELGHRLSPVQCSWLGYFNTTGLATMDYRLVDEYSAPSGADKAFVEQLIRLPRTSNCFLPPSSPPISSPPVLAAGRATFGSFNNPAKISRKVIATWSAILRRQPNSRLLLMYGTFEDPLVVEAFTQWFGEESIDASRLQFRGHAPMDAFLATVSTVDIALDPFPYSGETTALHCLWMGVPVVALEGEGLVQRLASRVLRVAKLNRWVAQSEADYIALAVRAATDWEDLKALRSTLRSQLRQSPLMDYEQFVRDLEQAYEAMLTPSAAG